MYSTGSKRFLERSKYSKTMNEMSTILNIIDLTTFIYIHINKNYQFFVLSNDINIENYFIKENGILGKHVTNIAETSSCGKISIILWDDYEDDVFLKTLYQFNIWNGISIALPFNQHIDIFLFGSSKERTHLNNFYLNHHRLLKRFIIYFRLKAKNIIAQAYKHLFTLNAKIDLYSQSTQMNISAIKNLRHQIPPRKALLKTRGLEKIQLTARETQYILMLLEGKSMCNIANELNISERTVESCINKIKLKTGYNTKVQILSAFLESQIYQPSINYDQYNQYQ